MVVSFIFISIIVIPGIALNIRRNRDVGLNGWGAFVYILYFYDAISKVWF
ncbi:DUF805 domain-containing protein [Enterococcus faecalis]|nr:hypothetical protein [Enterococcus faecalis]EGO5182582.1 hypothetical protein [Enterococcus faecalis]EGO7505729.1 hypothetical protein [Enterococcus faecalis]EGO8124913.1 hypothetical protein [Enterococcus faecalis]EGO8780540.1 hypothetical protein [Enterococcus faecalis]